MHLPVLTGLGREPTAAPPPAVQLARFEFDDAAVRFGLKQVLAANAAVVDAAKRKARLRFVGVPTDWLAPINQVIDETIEKLRLADKGYRGVTGAFGKQDWETSYAAADIFREASEDLKLITRAIESYSDAAIEYWRGKDAGILKAMSDFSKGRFPFPVRLIQCGDMFDLWLGMLCNFLPVAETATTPHLQLDNTWIAPLAGEFVDYWIESTLWNTQHSEGVAQFLAFSGEKTFLYGNHDNYLAPSGHTPNSLSALGGARIASWAKGNLFAEHGHRPDGFNRDGQDKGWFITQAAFRAPAVRNVEPGSRYAQVMAAADHWLSQPRGKRYGIYAMGHTHAPALMRVVVERLTTK